MTAYSRPIKAERSGRPRDGGQKYNTQASKGVVYMINGEYVDYPARLLPCRH